MCWSTKKEIILRTAKEDIFVYKIVYIDKYNKCFSSVNLFRYIANKKLFTVPLYTDVLGCVYEGYHSFKSINKIEYTHNLYKYWHKGIPEVDYDVSWGKVALAKFIIPKDSIYLINECDEIVSNNIIYTGKYKLLRDLVNVKDYSLED